MSDTLPQSKITDAFVASAIGNILGRRAESLSHRQVTERFGVLDDPFPGGNPAEPGGDLGTDENALMLIACNAYLQKGGRIAVEDEARTWMAEVNPLHFGENRQHRRVNPFWYLRRNTYELLKMGCPPQMAGYTTVPSNIALPVVGPVAAFNACDPDQAYLDALGLAALFQRERGILAPAVLAAAAAEALRPGASVDSVVEVALAVAPSTRLVSARPRRVDNLREAILEAVHVGRRYDDPLALRTEAYEKLALPECLLGEPQELLALTFAVFVAARGDTRLALIGGANMGRDADTLAGILGLLCGALNGIVSLPPAWLDGFQRLPGASALMAAAAGMAKLALARAKRQAAVADEILALAQ
jgi:ADP-ribosylglycohydrolase